MQEKMAMAREIAVFIDTEGKSALLVNPGKIVVYRKQMRKWQSVREMEFALDHQRGLREMRLQTAEMLQFLGDCHIFVAQAVVGVPYFELEKAQISVWEFEGYPIEFLDYIQAQEEVKNAETPKLVAIPVPEQQGPGRFFISIKEIQEHDVGVTSKQVLLPVIRRGGFEELELICNHVPPWLEFELLDSGYEAILEKIDNHSYRIIIRKR